MQRQRRKEWHTENGVCWERGGEGKAREKMGELERREREIEREAEIEIKKIMKKNDQVEINFFQWNP